MHENINRHDKEQKVTLYQKIMDAIMEQIHSGAFSFDTPICTENELMEKHSISRITARRAIAELENKGVLYRKRGVGSFVSRDIYSASQPQQAKVSRVFAFVLPFNISHTGLTEAVQAANAYLLERGFYAAVYITQDTNENRGRTILSRLISMDVAGVAYYPCTSNIHMELMDQLILQGKPVVLMDIPSHCPYLPSVSSDNLSGSRMLMKHLFDLGHKQIAYVSGVAPTARETVGDRFAGYLLSLSEAGITPDPRLIHTNVDQSGRGLPESDPASLRALIRQLVADGATAVVTEHDEIAYHILLCCRDLGISVPGQLSVCGFDKSEWATALAELPITTVEQNQATIGQAVAQMLYTGLEQPLTQRDPVVLPVRFIQGKTTGPAPEKSLISIDN